MLDALHGQRAVYYRNLLRSAADLREFSRPSQPEALLRIPANARVFWPIYTALAILPMLLYTLLSSHWLFTGSLMIGAMWAYAYLLKSEAPSLNIFGMPIPKALACGVFSLLVMLITGMLSAFLWAVVFGLLLALPHMVLHKVPSPETLAEEEMQSLQPV